MKWIQDVLLGLPTRHLGTKVLALLLSAGLFSFVQFSQTGTREIPRYVLELRLDDVLKGDHVLLEPRIELKSILITGLRSKVDPEAKRFLADPVWPLVIDQRFLARYSVDGLTIPINADLLRDDALFGKDVAITGLPAPEKKIQLDRIVVREFRIEVDPSLKLTLPERHNYEGTGEGGALVLSHLGQVKIHTPRSVFEGEESKLYFAVDPVRELIDFQTDRDRDVARLRNVRIQWRKSGFKDPAHLSVEAEELGPEPIPAADLDRALEVRCEVVQRKALRMIPIELVPRISRDYDLDDWECLGGDLGITRASVEAWVVESFPVRMPQNLWANEDLVKSLVLILNFANATEEGGGRLKVPVFLSLRNAEHEAHRDDLRLIEIGTRDQSGPQPVVTFQRKPE